jgi:hypothetical protein
MPRRPLTALIFSAVFSAAFLSAAPALAQSAPKRKGFMIGFGLGAGSTAVSSDLGDAQLGSAAYELHIGGMLTPGLALMFASSGTGGALNDNFNLFHSVNGVAVRGFFASRLWAEGGLGLASLSVKSDDNSLELGATGVGILGGFGVEVVRGPIFAMDLELQTAISGYSDAGAGAANLSLGLGFSWY